MRMAGFTLNNLTMLGLSLSTGIVIDDAIIVLENIFRHTEEERRPPFEAAIDGHPGDLAGRDGHHAVPGGDLPAGGLHGRAGRQVLELLRPHRHLRHHRLAGGGLHAHADARRADPLAAAPVGTHGRDRRARRPRPAGSITGSRRATRRRSAGVCATASCASPRPRSSSSAAAILLTSSRLEFVVDDDMSEFEVVAEAPPGSSIERSARDQSRAMEDGDPDDPGGHDALHHRRACAASTSPTSPTSRSTSGSSTSAERTRIAAGAHERRARAAGRRSRACA